MCCVYFLFWEMRYYLWFPSAVSCDMNVLDDRSVLCGRSVVCDKPVLYTSCKWVRPEWRLSS